MAEKVIEKPLKNRLLTERRLIDAVGSIIRTKGYTGLGVNAIAKEAKVNKKLIYRYFDNVDRLIETYVIEKDYWLSFNNKILEQIDLKDKKNSLIDNFVSILQKQFEFFWNEEEMQKIILWEISERTHLLDSVCMVREEYGNSLLAMTDTYFKNSAVSLRGVAALLVSGIYYLVLHAKKNESTICGLDVNTEEGRAEIQKSIRHIVEWAFHAGKSKIKPSRTDPPDAAE
ncbi:TetR/AcrR family transcriptional regulator [Pedobacter caeni]|uniref:Transcriptional regulator, TetR family n=1 Tax=Pedobacter caeni TaxID=288992 RepID=A0A1M5NBQ5_9SPHI|nr:TetR/AcrR family transcriptional regulator [Pedobacter caeni]SHG86882.1 transcriptional regulator, TetR family [Pedobacter caeni]